MALVCTIISFAQKAPTQLALDFSVPEYNRADITDFNSFLKTNNFPKASYAPFSFHFGLTLSGKNLRGTIDIGTSLGPNEQKYGDTTLTCGNDFAAIEFGYNVIHSNKLRIYPFFGFKSTGFSYNLEIKRTHSLSSYLQTPNNDKLIDYDRQNIIFGLGIEYGNKYVAGFKAGFYSPLNKGTWQVEGEVIDDKTLTIANKYFCALYFVIFR